MAKKNYTGINIQFPISQEILIGQKVIETRTYPIPEQYLGVDMLMIETPGKLGKFKARVLAVIRFTSCFKYESAEEFNKDVKRHKVTKDSPWAWGEKPKYGWRVQVVKKLATPIELKKKKGIVYTKDISL